MTLKEYEWTFNSRPNHCSYECLLTSHDAPPIAIFSSTWNRSKLAVLRDAMRHGFDRKNIDHHVRFKAYCH